MEALSDRSYNEAIPLRKVGSNNRIKGLSKTAKMFLNFELMRHGQELATKLKLLPKIQRYNNGTYAYEKKVFKNGEIECNKVMHNKMNFEYYGVPTLREEAEEQELIRRCYDY